MNGDTKILDALQNLTFKQFNEIAFAFVIAIFACALSILLVNGLIALGIWWWERRQKRNRSGMTRWR